MHLVVKSELNAWMGVGVCIFILVQKRVVVVVRLKRDWTELIWSVAKWTLFRPRPPSTPIMQTNAKTSAIFQERKIRFYFLMFAFLFVCVRVCVVCNSRLELNRLAQGCHPGKADHNAAVLIVESGHALVLTLKWLLQWRFSELCLWREKSEQRNERTGGVKSGTVTVWLTERGPTAKGQLWTASHMLKV